MTTMTCLSHIQSKHLTLNWSDTQKNNEFNKGSSKNSNGNIICDCEVDELVEELCPLDKLSELIQVLENDAKNLEAVSIFVQNHKDKTVTWNNSDYYLSLCDLSGTIHMGQKFMQEAWEELYLPKVTKMQVFGTLENSRCLLPCTQWIILVGEDGCVYAYGEEELQLIAKNLKDFVKNGKKTVYESYLYPEYSEEDEKSFEQDEEIQKIKQSTRDYVNESAKEFEDFLLLLS